MQQIHLYWHNYKFFPYEKKFAIREVKSLLQPKKLEEAADRLTISAPANNESIRNLVYFSHAQIKKEIVHTRQFNFENGAKNIKKYKRQNTRYSVHGLHEYKGKFNPQVVRSLLNIYRLSPGDHILDPFCGSGTTLVEAAHSHMHATGYDINPLAVFIANTKLDALRTDAGRIMELKTSLLKNFKATSKKIKLGNDPRTQYLANWFPKQTLLDIESLRVAAQDLPKKIGNIYLVLISNLLRNYSLQEPSDLRIRRRFSPFPTTPLIEELNNAIDYFASNLKAFQSSFALKGSTNLAICADIKNTGAKSKQATYDFAVTSPPYATALPYIDTQRLSLVWLELVESTGIRKLESELIGSREFTLKDQVNEWTEHLAGNRICLPEEIHSFCQRLHAALKPTDGFRRQAVPSLLYRYFHDMRAAFEQVHRLLKSGKYFCLIVGHNHTTIGGHRTDINTPELLTFVGKQAGFQIDEVVELDAYQRYGLHSSNAVQKESLIVFRK